MSMSRGRPRGSVKPETIWTGYVRRRLTLAFGFDCRLVKIRGGLGQEPGVADLVGVVRGRGVALELKTPGGRHKVSVAQEYFLRSWTAAGGFSMVVDSEESLKAAIEFLSKI